MTQRTFDHWLSLAPFCNVGITYNNCSTSCNFLPSHQDESMAGDYLCYNRKTALNVKTWNADTKHYREPIKSMRGRYDGIIQQKHSVYSCSNKPHYLLVQPENGKPEASSPNSTTHVIIPANLLNWYFFYKTTETSQKAFYDKIQRPTPKEAAYPEFPRRKEEVLKLLKLVDVVRGINLDLFKTSEQCAMGIACQARNEGI